MPPDPPDPDDRLPLARPVRRRDDEDDDAPEYEPDYDAGPSSNDKTMGLLAHLLGLFTWVVGPAVLLLNQADKSPFVGRHAREALNCQVMQIIYATLALVVAGLAGVGVYVLTGKGQFGFVAGYLVYILIALGFFALEIVCVVKGCIAANKGEEFRYPLVIRFF